MEKLPSYEQISDDLLESRIFMEAAEVHGLLVGLLVCNPQTSADIWITMVTEDSEAWQNLDIELQAEYEEIREITLAQIIDVEFHFELLLPTDDELLAERAHALGLWCKGFVHGVESHGNYLGELMGKAQEEVDEALSDLNSIAELDYNVKEQEAQEKALTSVVEYVRIAVLLVQRELSSNFNQAASGSTSIH